MRTRRILTCFLLALATFSAFAFERPFPAAAKRGTMTPGYYPEITLDGKARHLSAGARIWNQDNLVEMPTALRGSGLVVNYTENSAGEIDRVWILTRDEADKDPAPQPAK